MRKLFRKVLLYFHTIRYLTFTQLYYQALYRAKKSFNSQRLRAREKVGSGVSLRLRSSIPYNTSYYHDCFEFLNRRKEFEGSVEWDFPDYGRLWVYNLNYFDFLHQADMTGDEGTRLMVDYCKKIELRKEAWEPYTISLRGINWIKFFTYHGIKNPHLDQKLYNQYRHLVSNLEYHLLGNHLLENGFSMLFGAYYFRDDSFYNKASKILNAELKEQILFDGAHFELSPMYHQIILFRLLDTINLVMMNEWKSKALLPLLINKASAMLGWLKAVTFRNGDIPMVNDSASDIAPSSRQLFDYADRLSIDYDTAVLSDSGYQMIRSEYFELLVDIGGIGPDYIPGHAHSDTFNFILYINGHPIVVDTGTSTYQDGDRRHLERSTASHNTVSINHEEQSEIWGSFRVSRRAKVTHSERREGEISASHDGYKRLGISHTRTWRWERNSIYVTDQIQGKRASHAAALLHFHPSVQLELGASIVQAGPLTIRFNGNRELRLEEYEFAVGFNKTVRSQALRIVFDHELTTTMTLQSTTDTGS